IKPVEVGLTLLLCLLMGLAVSMTADMRLSWQFAMVAAFFFCTALVVFPQKKQLLIIAWILIHPLSIEKVIEVGSPLMPEFFPPALVISGSDIILFMLLLLLLFESLILQRRRVWSFPKAMTPLFLFVAWNLIVFLLHPISTSSILALVHLLKITLFVIIMISAISTEHDYKIVLQAIAVSVAIQVVLVFYSSFSGDIIRLSSKITNSIMSFAGEESGLSHIRATGTVGHVNQEASFLTFFSLPLIVLPFLYHRFQRILFWLLLCSVPLAVFLTYSRSAWLAMIVSILVIIGLSFYYRLLSIRTWVYLFPFILTAILSLPIISKPVLDRIIHGDEGATSSRIRSIELALDLTKKHPITGVGPGLFSTASLAYYPPQQITAPMRSALVPPNPLANQFGRLEISQIKIGTKIFAFPLPVHNKFLLVLSELGVVGLLLFLWFQWRIFSHIQQTIKHSFGPTLWAGIGLLSAFFASLIYMNLDLFSDDKTMQILLIVPILAMSLHQISLQDCQE
ncbi:MAG: O-antigen ligase family protein, partial [Desulfocapsaceae bacterium]|nr:O-antigen ligase family protein [Desulfocapsaceae bacterium]